MPLQPQSAGRCHEIETGARHPMRPDIIQPPPESWTDVGSLVVGLKPLAVLPLIPMPPFSFLGGQMSVRSRQFAGSRHDAAGRAANGHDRNRPLWPEEGGVAVGIETVALSDRVGIKGSGSV